MTVPRRLVPWLLGLGTVVGVVVGARIFALFAGG